MPGLLILGSWPLILDAKDAPLQHMSRHGLVPWKASSRVAAFTEFEFTGYYAKKQGKKLFPAYLNY